MQRIFAFDPGTSAIGWAVIETTQGGATSIAAGVRSFALARQRALLRIKQRLKPEQRMKLRQRMLLRREELGRLLARIGVTELSSNGQYWERDDRTQLDEWLAASLVTEIPRHAIARILFNAHKHRSASQYGPQLAPTRAYVETMLALQSKWHGEVLTAAARDEIVGIIFRRRKPERQPKNTKAKSPLSTILFNEFVRLGNALKRKHGNPTLVAMEAPVDPSEKRRPDEAAVARLALQLSTVGRPPTRRNLLRARLFESQVAQGTTFATCPLTGAQFEFADVFTAKIEIDHGVPVSRNGTGGKGNLSLCMADANRRKAAKVSAPEGLATAAHHPRKGRVSIVDAGAMREAGNLIVDFIKTQFDMADVTMISPASVARARSESGILKPAKDRADLRHHAEDAILIGTLCPVQADLEPVDGELRAEIRTALQRLIVSVKPERRRAGQLHDETRYGRPHPNSGFDPASHVVSRKPIGDLTIPMIGRIVDPSLRANFSAANRTNVESLHCGRMRRVKVARSANAAISVLDRTGRPVAYVLAADNHHLDIVQMRDGSWRAFGATRHAVALKGWRPHWEAMRLGGKLIMRLHKGDMLTIEDENGEPEIVTVIRLGAAAGTVHLSPHWRAQNVEEIGIGGKVGNYERPRAYAASSLKKVAARAIHVSETGDISYRPSNVAESGPADLGQRART